MSLIDKRELYIKKKKEKKMSLNLNFSLLDTGWEGKERVYVFHKYRGRTTDGTTVRYF